MVLEELDPSPSLYVLTFIVSSCILKVTKAKKNRFSIINNMPFLIVNNLL